MDELTITLPDGAEKRVPAGTTIAEFVRVQIGAGLAKAALFARYDGAVIEKAANELVAADLQFERREVSRDEALALFGKLGEKLKLEIIEDIFAKGAKTLSLYSHGEWVDFCLGPHGPSTKRVGVIKILSSSGSYWRGDHRNAQLQRI